MTTQPNEHQKVLLDYVSKTLGMFSATRMGAMTAQQLIEECNKFDIAALEKSVAYLIFGQDEHE